jgi:opacity protein-like surface antigen
VRVRFPILLLLASCATPAWAYRPFESVEAAVSEPGELEIESGFAYSREDGERAWLAPALDMNYGIGADREVGFEMALRRASERPSGRSGYSVEDLEVTVKQLLRAGSLQDGSGASLAAECAALVPTSSGERPGGSCVMIASHAWRALALHFNAGFEYGREHEWERATGLVLELGLGALRPGIEMLYESGDGDGTFALLAGATWQAAENLSLDVAYRGERHGGEEWRTGFTWTSD